MAFLNFDVAPVPDLWNVATPTKPIITIPTSIYGYGNGDDAEEWGSRGMRDEPGRTCDKARRCSRLVRPLEQFSKRMVPLVETHRVQSLLY